MVIARSWLCTVWRCTQLNVGFTVSLHVSQSTVGALLDLTFVIAGYSDCLLSQTAMLRVQLVARVRSALCATSCASSYAIASALRLA